MVSLGINKPNSKTIRNPSVNLWSSLPGTLGQWCQAPRGRVLAAAQLYWARARPGSPRAPRTVAGTSPPCGLPSARLSPAGALRPSRRPARGPPPAALSTDPRDLPLWGSAQARGRCCHPLEPGCSRGSCFFLSPLKGWPEKGRGFCKVCWGCTRAPEERPRLRRTD